MVPLFRKNDFRRNEQNRKNTHFDGKLGYGSYISAHCDIAMTELVSLHQ